MKTVQLKSAVGGDGFLTLRIPFTQDDVGQEVTVTVEPSQSSGKRDEARELIWRRALKATYGAGAGLGIKRHEDGHLTERDPIE